MFLVEALVERNTRWDSETSSFLPCLPYLTNPCGLGYSMYVNLKTVKGAIKRINQQMWSKSVKEIKIFKVTSDAHSQKCLVHILYPGEFNMSDN